MKNFKAIAFASLALLPAGVLAACGSGSTTGTASSSGSGATAADAQANGTTPPNGQNGGGPPGMGTEVTGTAATKAGDAATAKYGGTVERVMKLDDDSYAVMLTGSDASSSDSSSSDASTGNANGMQIVLVSSSYEVTGLQERPSGTPPNGGQAPDGTAGTTPPSSSSSSTTSSSSAATAS